MTKFHPYSIASMNNPQGPPSFAASIKNLCGHILGSAALFSVVAAIAWAIGVAVAFLHEQHPFQPEVLKVLHNVELWLLYVDVAPSGVVLLVGGYRFIKEIGGRP